MKLEIKNLTIQTRLSQFQISITITNQVNIFQKRKLL